MTQWLVHYISFLNTKMSLKIGYIDFETPELQMALILVISNEIISSKSVFLSSRTQFIVGNICFIHKILIHTVIVS